MENNVWLQQVVVGHPAMDCMHEEVLDQMAYLSAGTDAEFAHGLFDLIARMEREFEAEERLMDAIDFEGLRIHREQHARALSGLHHVAPRVMGGDIAAGRSALDLLAQWFQFHLMTMDVALATALDIESAFHLTEQCPPTDAANERRGQHP